MVYIKGVLYMIKKCMTELFSGDNIKDDIRNYINSNINRHKVIDIKEVPYNNSILVTIIYEIDSDVDYNTMLKDIVDTAKKLDVISMNTVQNELQLGFNSTSKYLNLLEDLNIISKDKPRKLLVSKEEAYKIIDNNYEE